MSYKSSVTCVVFNMVPNFHDEKVVWRPYRESNPGYFLGLGATWKALFKDIYDTFDTDVRYPVALP